MSNLDAQAAAQREIARLQRLISGYRTQAGSRGVAQRAQIPALEARIAEYQRQMETGEYGGDIQARVQQAQDNRGRSAQAPKGSLSAQAANKGVQKSKLPGSVGGVSEPGVQEVRVLRPGQKTQVSETRVPYRPEYAGVQRSRLRGTIAPDNPYAALVDSEINFLGFQGSRAFGRRLQKGLSEEYEKQQNARVRGGVVRSALPGSVEEARYDVFGFSAPERFVKKFENQVQREELQRQALAEVDARYPLLAPALTLERMIRTAPNTLLSVQDRAIAQGASIGRGFGKIQESLNPLGNRLTEEGAIYGRRFFNNIVPGEFPDVTEYAMQKDGTTKSTRLYYGDVNAIPRTSGNRFFTNKPLDIFDPDVQQAGLFLLTVNPFSGPGLRIAAALNSEFAAPVRTAVDELGGRVVDVLETQKQERYSRGFFTKSFALSPAPKVSEQQKQKESTAGSNGIFNLKGTHIEINPQSEYIKVMRGVGNDFIGLGLNVVETGVEGVRLAARNPLLAYGAARVFGAGEELFGRGFGYFVGAGLTAYSAYEAPPGEVIKTTVEQGSANLVFAGAFGDLRKGFRRATGSYRPDVLRVGGFPRMPRQVTYERLVGLEGERLPTITGKGAGRDFYVGEPKYAGTQGSTGYFANPVSTEVGGYRVYRYGEFAVNPYRNPTFYRNVVRDIMTGKRSKFGLKDATFSSPELTLAEYRVSTRGSKEDIGAFYGGKAAEAERAGVPVVTVAPKTLRGYSQPEEEIFALASRDVIARQRRVKIGVDEFGVPVTKMMPRTYKTVTLPASSFPSAEYRAPLKVTFEDRLGDFVAGVKVKAAARVKSYGAQFRAQDLFAKDVSERGLVKYRLMKKNSPLANVIDNSGNLHVERIKKIGRALGEEYGIEVDVKILDAFADVHDINKEPVRNFSVAKAIERGLRQGYLDEVTSVRGLTPDQRAEVGRVVVLDEKPPINLGNLLKRPIETIRYSPRLLSQQEKVLINADRLARFGSRADPDMLFKLGGEVPSLPLGFRVPEFELPIGRGARKPQSLSFGEVDEAYYAQGRRGVRVPNYLEVGVKSGGQELVLGAYESGRRAPALRLYAGGGSRRQASFEGLYSPPARMDRYAQRGKAYVAPKGRAQYGAFFDYFGGGGGGGYGGDGYFGEFGGVVAGGNMRVKELPFDERLLVPKFDLGEVKVKRKGALQRDKAEYVPSLVAVVFGFKTKRKPFEEAVTPFGIRPVVSR